MNCLSILLNRFYSFFFQRLHSEVELKEFLVAEESLIGTVVRRESIEESKEETVEGREASNVEGTVEDS